jgi:hypothetical protein
LDFQLAGPEINDKIWLGMDYGGVQLTDSCDVVAGGGAADFTDDKPWCGIGAFDELERREVAKSCRRNDGH